MKKELLILIGLVLAIYGTAKLVNLDRDTSMRKSCRVGILQYDGRDEFVSEITKKYRIEAKNFEKDNPDIDISINVLDAMDSQERQNSQAEHLAELKYDILCVNLVDRTSASRIIDISEKSGIPVIFFNREPVENDLNRSDRLYYEGSDAMESAKLQGSVIADAFKDKKNGIDKNGDGVLQCAILEGERGHQDAVIRSEYVLKELWDEGIKVDLCSSAIANWDRKQASNIVSNWIGNSNLREGLEVIISNNDSMALGAIDALDASGIDDIKVVGIDGTKEALNAVFRGKMLGTVLCDTGRHAKALMEMTDAVAIHTNRLSELGLEGEKYYRIPLQRIENIKKK